MWKHIEDYVETSKYALSIYSLECEKIYFVKKYITTTRYNILVKPTFA